MMRKVSEVEVEKENNNDNTNEVIKPEEAEYSTGNIEHQYFEEDEIQRNVKGVKV